MRILCSHCYKSMMGCMCENFHPPILSGIDKNLAEILLNHYDSVGWISYEEWPRVHDFIKELNDFVEDN